MAPPEGSPSKTEKWILSVRYNLVGYRETFSDPCPSGERGIFVGLAQSSQS